MENLTPPQPRSRISDTIEGLEIVIPAQRRLLVSVFLLLWLGGWAYGEVSVINEMLESPDPEPMLLFWLAAWTLAGLFVVALLAWSLAGREVVRVTPSAVRITRRAFGIGRTKSYDAMQIRDLRVSPAKIASSRPRAGRRAPRREAGGIEFDYGASTVKFGSGLDENEAQQIVDRIRPRLPSS